MKKQRKHYTPEEKVAILRRHLLEKEPISKLCDEVGLRPTVFYRWQKEFFENGAAAFEQKRPTHHSALLTWNQKHLANPFMYERVDNVFEEHGYETPIIATPEQFLEAGL